MADSGTDFHTTSADDAVVELVFCSFVVLDIHSVRPVFRMPGCTFIFLFIDQEADLGSQVQNETDTVSSVFSEGQMSQKGNFQIIHGAVDMLRSLAEAREVVVLRDGKEEQILMPEMSLLEIAKEDPPFVDMLIPNVVDSVLADGGFAKAGLQKGDSLIAFNGTPLHSWNEFTEQLGELRLRSEVEQKSSASFSLVYSRAGVRDTVNVTTDDQFKVLAYSMNPGYQPTRLTYGFFESFPAGVALGINTLKGYVNDMKYVFTKEGAKSVGGFGTIGSIFPKVWDWQRFWSMTAFLSIILAFMNILPIPALDGGHVLFLLYELVARRKPSDKFLEYAQMVGMFLLFGLLIWANFNDILRFVF